MMISDFFSGKLSVNCALLVSKTRYNRTGGFQRIPLHCLFLFTIPVLPGISSFLFAPEPIRLRSLRFLFAQQEYQLLLPLQMCPRSGGYSGCNLLPGYPAAMPVRRISPSVENLDKSGKCG